MANADRNKTTTKNENNNKKRKQQQKTKTTTGVADINDRVEREVFARVSSTLSALPLKAARHRSQLPLTTDPRLSACSWIRVIRERS
jgi:hypothetical protein